MRAAVAIALFVAAPAVAAEPEELRRALEQRYPVQVLRLEPAEHEGRRVHVATVMVLPGDYNDAMRVERLMLDDATGALVVPPRTAGGAAGGVRLRQEGMERLADRRPAR